MLLKSAGDRMLLIKDKRKLTSYPITTMFHVKAPNFDLDSVCLHSGNCTSECLQVQQKKTGGRSTCGKLLFNGLSSGTGRHLWHLGGKSHNITPNQDYGCMKTKECFLFPWQTHRFPTNTFFSWSKDAFHNWKPVESTQHDRNRHKRYSKINSCKLWWPQKIAVWIPSVVFYLQSYLSESYTFAKQLYATLFLSPWCAFYISWNGELIICYDFLNPIIVCSCSGVNHRPKRTEHRTEGRDSRHVPRVFNQASDWPTTVTLRTKREHLNTNKQPPNPSTVRRQQFQKVWFHQVFCLAFIGGYIRYTHLEQKFVW